MAEAYLDFSPEVLMEICRAATDGSNPRRFQVVKDGLPADVEFVRCEPVNEFGVETVRLWLRSEEFTEGVHLPQPVMKTVFDAPAD